MKTKTSFLMYFVIFTAFLATAQAQDSKGPNEHYFTFNAQDNDLPADQLKYPTGRQFAEQIFDATPKYAVTAYEKCDASCQANIVAIASTFALPQLKKLMVVSNRASGGYLSGQPVQITANNFKECKEKFLQSLEVVDVDFMGNTAATQVLVWSSETKNYYAKWLKHENVKTIRWVISRQGSYVALIGKADCNQPNDEETMGMVANGKAKIVAPAAKGGDVDDVDIEKIKTELMKQLSNSGNGGQPINVNININKTGESTATAGGSNGRDGKDGRDGNSYQQNNQPQVRWSNTETLAPGFTPGGGAWVSNSGSSNSSNTNYQRQAACPECAAAMNDYTADFALLEKQGQVQIAQNRKMIQQNKVANAGIWTGVGIQTGEAVYTVLRDQGIIPSIFSRNSSGNWGGGGGNTGTWADFPNGLRQ